MSFAAANKARGSKSKKSAPEPVQPQPAEVPKTVLGVNLRGELMDVKLELVIDPIGPSDRMPRPGDDEAIQQLAYSMAECGQLQPVMLEQLADGQFCRVFGRRRLAAARRLGWTTIRASVVPPLADDVRRTVVAIENVQRQDLMPAEETLAVDELMLLQAFSAAKRTRVSMPIGPDLGRVVDDEVVKRCMSASGPNVIGYRRALLDMPDVRLEASEQVAAMLGKPASWVRDRLYIGRLSPLAKTFVLEGKLPLAHAREISKVGDPKRREELAKAYAAGGSDSISDVEPGQLADLQEEVRKCVFALNVVPWRLEVPFGGQPACVGCPHNSATNPGLFEGGGEVSLSMIGGRGTYDSTKANSEKVLASGICTMPACYADKLRGAKAAISAAAKRIVDGDKKPADAKVPAFVAASALDKRVRSQRELKKSGRSRTAKVEMTPQMKLRREREEAARNAGYKLADALRERAKKLEAPLVKYLSAKPCRWAMYLVLKESKLWQATEADDKRGQSAAQSPALRRLITLITEPSLDRLAEIEKTCGTQFGLIDAWNEAESGVLDVVADVFRIKIDEPPTLEQFMPAKFREGKEKPAGEPSRKSGGKSKGKGRTRSSTASGAAESGEANEPDPDQDDDGGDA